MANERYTRIVRHPVDDELVIRPPVQLLEYAEELGSDPRVPASAIGRHISTLWRTAHLARREHEISGIPPQPSTIPEREIMARPQHYPTDWGIGAIPFPSDLPQIGSKWMQDYNTTVCYTSLSVPRPFDPHLHGDMSATTPPQPGFGFQYLGESAWLDRFDITARRGGGPRGGFAFTTGPTEGNYPSTVLPSPTFDLGRLGYSNGGWNPEGLQYNQRPKTMRLTGLRNTWPHKAYFVRSRQVMFRNVYGQISTTEATPRAPNVILNGSTPLHGIIGIKVDKEMNSPSVAEIEISNIAGRRSGLFKVSDTIQIYAAPRHWATPPLVMTGFIRDINEGNTSITITVTDSLGYLGLEPILTTPTFFQSDAATVIRDIVANSSYVPPLGRIMGNTNVYLPSGMKFVGKTRLAAIQLILAVCNDTPNLFRINCDKQGRIQLMKLPEIEDANVQPYIAGRLPRTDTPQDLYPTSIVREEGDTEFFNVVTITNDDLDIKVQVPSDGDPDYPSRPIHRVFSEDAAQDKVQARLIGRQMLAQQGRDKVRWVVEALPERFDLEPGDVVEFASVEGALAGRQMIFNASWQYSPGGSSMSITVGKAGVNLIAAIRYASGLSMN